MSILGNLEAFGTALEERFSDLETKIGKELRAKQDETGGKETAAIWKRIFALENKVIELNTDLGEAEGKLNRLSITLD